MQTKLTIAAVFVVSAGIFSGLAQTPASQTQVFDFTNKPSQQGLQEIATILRTVGNIKQLSIDSAAASLTVSGTTDELAMSGWIIHQLDQPIPLPATAPQPTAISADQFLVAGKSDDVIRIFHLTTVAPQPAQPMQEALTVLRTVADIQKVFNYSALSDLVVRGPAAQIALAQYLINSLDVAKSSATASPEFQYQPPGENSTVVRVFYLANVSMPQQVQEILTTLRTVGNIQKVFNFTKINALAIRGTTVELAASEFMIQSLDIPAAPKTGQTPNIREYQMPIDGRQSATVVHVFYPAYLTTPKAVQETLTTLRTVGGLQKAFNNSKPVALIYRGSADQIAKGDQLIQQADKPIQTATAAR